MPVAVRLLLNSKDKLVSQLIPEEVVQEVLLRTDMVDVIGDYVQLKRTGANAQGLCPFHQEKTPSFSVNPVKGFFYCFGCHASGDVFRFLMQHESMTFPEAVRFLAARYGVRIPEASLQQRRQETSSPLYALHQAATTFFHECLLHDPAAQPARLACRQRQITTSVGALLAMIDPGVHRCARQESRRIQAALAARKGRGHRQRLSRHQHAHDPTLHFHRFCSSIDHAPGMERQTTNPELNRFNVVTVWNPLNP